MPVTRRDRDVGELHISLKGGLPKLQIWGLIATNTVVEALRDVPEDEELSHYPPEKIQGVIEALKAGWGEIDQYCTVGGAVSTKGLVRIYEEFRDGSDPTLHQNGFYATGRDVVNMKSKFRDGRQPAGALYVAAPELQGRLQVYRIPGGRALNAHRVILPRDKIREGFVDGLVKSFGIRMGAVFEDYNMDPVLSSRKAAEMRFYDHARRQVPPLEQM